MKNKDLGALLQLLQLVVTPWRKNTGALEQIANESDPFERSRTKRAARVPAARRTYMYVLT
jgi:hypothetical protein